MSQKLLSEYSNNIKSLIEEKARKEDIEKDDRKRKYFEEVGEQAKHTPPCSIISVIIIKAIQQKHEVLYEGFKD
jgi:hypothetical protein